MGHSPRHKKSCSLLTPGVSLMEGNNSSRIFQILPPLLPVSPPQTSCWTNKQGSVDSCQRKPDRKSMFWLRIECVSVSVWVSEREKEKETFGLNRQLKPSSSQGHQNVKGKYKQELGYKFSVYSLLWFWLGNLLRNYRGFFFSLGDSALPLKTNKWKLASKIFLTLIHLRGEGVTSHTERPLCRLLLVEVPSANMVGKRPKPN